MVPTYVHPKKEKKRKETPQNKSTSMEKGKKEEKE